MRMKQIFLSVLLLGSIVWATPQNADSLRAEFISLESYPSLIPVPMIRVHSGDFADLGPNPCNTSSAWGTFDSTSKSSYKVTDTQGHAIPIQELRFLIKLTTTFPCRTNDFRDVRVAFLILDRGIHNGDQLNVSLVSNNGTSFASTAAPIKVAGVPRITFNLNPQAAPGEKLTNGNKRDVGQLKVNFNDPLLCASCRWKFARLYLESTDLFSTDAKDTNAKFEGTFGAQFNLTSSWYIPARIETKLQGDQTAQNLSSLEGIGITTLLPWAGLKPILFNPAIQAPLSPLIKVDAQYERRINQDTASLKKFPNQNDFRLNPSLSWTSIRLLPSLGNAVAQSPDLLDFEINLKSWYLPFDQTAPKGGRQRFEAGGDVSLLVPLAALSKLKYLNTIVPFFNPAEGGSEKFRIRIKYSAGANDANGFKHSRQWNFGMEADASK